jgi:outer membrane receptor protein involved in Fe transport
LRGSSNFRVLIDGRPTVLDASDALEQIPASTIENIEIITNPSAKHDPEGAAGIINIVLKEDEELGRSGIVNLNAGYDDKYGIDALLNYNKRKYNTSLSVDFNQRNYDGSDREMNQTFLPGGDSFVHSTGESGRGRSRYGIRGSFEYKFNRKNSLSLGGRFRDGESSNQSFLDYDTWKEPGGEHTFYLSNTERSRGGYDVDLYMTYLRQFARKGQELVAEIEFERGTGDELTTNELLTPDGIITSGQRSTESGPSEEVRAKLDYVHPLGEYSKFEAGYQSDYDRSKEETGLSEYSTDLQAYEVLDEFSNLTQYDRYIHALYAIYGGKRHSLGYQAGIRGEYTNRTVDVTRSAESFKIDRWDYFPTLHFSYEFSQGNQAMASYTRRIDRPRGWYLEPFDTWMDAYNVRRGNPGLKPEYIDSYEAGYQTMLGNTVVSAETYYRANNNKVESVRSVYGDNITLQTMENVGKDYSFGTELMLGLEPLKQWDLNLMGNLYKYRVEGVIADESFDRESFNWSLRFNNNFKFSESLQFQLHTIYNSPTVSSQGRREAFFMTNVAVKYVFFEKLLSATLQVRDLLGTAKYERTSRGNDFYIYNYGTRESPVVMVNLKYNFNNYESERRDDNGAQGEGFGGDDF